jgi:ACR3 family arsenite efflux pump ArsB
VEQFVHRHRRLDRDGGDSRRRSLIMWVAGFTLGKLTRLPYAQTASMGFIVPPTTSSWRLRSPSASSAPPRVKRSPESSAPLIEVTVLVTLVYVALWACHYWREPPKAIAQAGAIGP